MAMTGNGREHESDVTEHYRVINLLINRIKHYEDKVAECKKYNVRDQLPINEAVLNELNRVLYLIDDKREQTNLNMCGYWNKPE